MVETFEKCPQKFSFQKSAAFVIVHPCIVYVFELFRRLQASMYLLLRVASDGFPVMLVFASWPFFPSLLRTLWFFGPPQSGSQLLDFGDSSHLSY